MFTKLLKNILALAVFGVLGYLLYTNFGGVWVNLYAKYFPCKTEIVYNLGTFDTRFGLSKKDFLANMAEAEKIWEKSAGRELFTYNPDATFKNAVKVNLVYDYRQEATVKIRALGIAVSDTRASYDSLKAKHAILEKEHSQLQIVYKSKNAEFQTRQDAYQKKVAQWNSKGGAPQDVYEELNEEADALKKELSALRKMESEINIKVDDINALVTVINKLARTLNINTRELNTIGATRGEEFTEGEYKESTLGKEIYIYEFSTNEKLIRVLAHELGHALGLDHVSDPKAIMYYLNENKNGIPTEADVMALKNLCEIK